MVFVLDGSGSVGPNRFGLFKLFVQKLILQLNVGENGTRVAVMQLGDIKETKFEFGINNHSDVSTLLLAIENIKYQYGRLQKTEIALRLAETKNDMSLVSFFLSPLSILSLISLYIYPAILILIVALEQLLIF